MTQVLPPWLEYPKPFDLSYKYSAAHMYSVAAPPFAKRDLLDMPSSLRTWMELRNDDIYSFRWGDPAYARAYLRALPGPSVMAGFKYGAGWIYVGPGIH